MAGPFVTREDVLVHAIADTVVSRTDILRTTNLVSPGAPLGSNVLPVVSVSGFDRRGYVHFFDNTGERMAAIGDLDPNTNQLTLDYTGYSQLNLAPGLVSDHLAGALVATNLMLHQPRAIAPMLRGGDPVVCIWPRSKRTGDFTFGSTLSPTIIRVQVHLSLKMYDADPIDGEVFSQIQQERSHAYMQQLENALNQNRHLNNQHNNPGNTAMGLGYADGKNQPFATTMWDTVLENIDIPQAIGAMDVIVRPAKYVRQEPGS